MVRSKANLADPGTHPVTCQEPLQGPQGSHTHLCTWLQARRLADLKTDPWASTNPTDQGPGGIPNQPDARRNPRMHQVLATSHQQQTPLWIQQQPCNLTPILLNCNPGDNSISLGTQPQVFTYRNQSVNGKLFSNRKEWTTDICNTMDESKQSGWLKKPNKSIQTVWFYLHEILENANQVIMTDSTSVVVWGQSVRWEGGIPKESKNMLDITEIFTITVTTWAQFHGCIHMSNVYTFELRLC